MSSIQISKANPHHSKHSTLKFCVGPAHAGDANEPSPIQPLPSPKHILLTNRTTQPTEHKKSLLSLFTKPSPLISPAPTAPASAIDPSSFISPLLEKSTPREQANAAFVKLARDIEGFPQGYAALLPLSPSRATSVNAVVAGMAGGEERARVLRKRGDETGGDLGILKFRFGASWW